MISLYVISTKSQTKSIEKSNFLEEMTIHLNFHFASNSLEAQE